MYPILVQELANSSFPKWRLVFVGLDVISFLKSIVRLQARCTDLVSDVVNDSQSLGVTQSPRIVHPYVLLL